ncbi:type II toxin-antitoxin system RelE/ParE family toxin [Magnetovibrio sp. PR-2]|uniref:type II toxin-antitoxin system RelE/ParE family toxin n=1 Tax=Magnetovibrio sp. PR-2 TaxID=3120356 RepID=UPI002FCE0518
MTEKLITIAETQAYLSQAKGLLNDSDRQVVIDLIAADPTCGSLLQNTGGVRKVRIPLSGRGKSGGARVVYFFHDNTIPVYLLAVFAKNEKDNLTKAERNALKTATTAIVKAWKTRTPS